MKVSRIKLLLLGLLTLFIIALGLALYTDQSIRKQVSEKRFLAPTKYYSSPKKFFINQVYSLESIEDYFSSQHYRKRSFGSPMSPGDYAIGDEEQCKQAIDTKNDLHYCITFRSRFANKLYFLSLNEWNQLNAVFSGDQFTPVLFAEAEASVFAQYLGDKPTQQIHSPLGEIPRYCLEAVLAIEDPYFLEHRGVSPRGILRAFVTNIQKARWSQGGSTITQQLVKNYFLSPEKTISRKIKEILISLIFEFRVSKDDILETYLNIIYLGQNGVFEVRGYKAAAEHYFQKPLSELNLADCSLLAAIINSPGRYNPIRHPERAKERRLRVLTKMKEHNMVFDEEFEEAKQAPLPTKIKTQITASAPYYVDAVNKKLKQLGYTELYGLNIFTALDPEAQSLAEKAVRNGIQYFEKNLAHIKKIKENGHNLQAALLSSNPLSGEITAIVGGRNFSSSPFNRAIESQRQVGSVFKPIVYLTALKNVDETDSPYTPLTLINNSPFRYEYEGQVWEPNNYSKKFSPPVPLFFALKESLNVPTARLATTVGLNKIITTARELGVTSTLKEYPSISLGAFELNPLEVLQAYSTLASLGEKRELRILKKVTNQSGDILFEESFYKERVGDVEDYAILISMMKETLTSGTGAYSRKMGFTHIAAGKTGTTSDTKDAWFAGFTPFHVAVTWIGYDDQGQSHGLTGASGALPIWTNYMRDISKKYSNVDWSFPESVHKETLSSEKLLELEIPQEKAKETDLYFKND